MVNCFMARSQFSLNVVKTYIIQLRLSLQAGARSERPHHVARLGHRLHVHPAFGQRIVSAQVSAFDRGLKLTSSISSQSGSAQLPNAVSSNLESRTPAFCNCSF